MDNLYREIILEHYKSPLHYGVIKDADIDVSEVNPLCGDEIRLTVKLKDKTISEIAFESQGCAISKASSSLFTDEISGKSLEEVEKMKPQEILDLLEVELTPARTKCALLVYQTFNKGLADRSS